MKSKDVEDVAPHLVLYDGVCGLCNRFNQFVLRHDARGRFRFASLQSGTAARVLAGFGRTPADLNTVFVIARYECPDAVLLDRGAAVLFVLRDLGWPWRAASVARVIPTPLLNRLYDVVAHNRYRVFGQSDVCLLPSPEYRKRFIDL